MSTSGEQFYEFGDFRIDVANRLLFHDGQASSLTPKTVETLIALVRRKGEVLNKDELLKTIWPDRVVEEGNLTQNIYLLRKTLGKAPDGKDYIETVPRRGYRFARRTAYNSHSSSRNEFIRTVESTCLAVALALASGRATSGFRDYWLLRAESHSQIVRREASARQRRV